jgi:FkbM family methyltransferase
MGGIQAKLDQTIQIQKSLKETSEAMLLKADQNTAYQHEMNALGESTHVKVDQVIQNQQDLIKKADLAIAVQQELIKKTDQVFAGQQQLKGAVEGASAKADKVLCSQQELLKKADQAQAGQQQLKGSVEGASAKADKVLSSQQELMKKADQALAGQLELKEFGNGTADALEKITANQQLLINETEFSRRSRTLFAANRFWEDNFYKAIKGIDIEEKYDRLTSGLSDDDRAKVELIISRIQHLCEEGDKTCYLPEEAERIYRNQKELSKIVRLSEHCYIYKNFKLPVNVFEMSTFACNYGLDLISHPEYCEGKDIIDAGAYIGDSALVFNRFFSKCRRIYAFEPDAGSYALMGKTIAMNKLTNIIPVKMALGDSNGEARLTGIGMGVNLLGHGQEAKNNKTVNVIRLDDYVAKNSIVPGAIKTDLEGFEIHFLRGALETIKKYRPILVLSIYHSADDFFGIKPFIENLDLGYSFKLFKADDGMILGGTCLICCPDK